MNQIARRSVAERFHALHRSGCFILPNPWDMGTAVYLADLGFEALATTSAGFAFSRGRQDGAVPRDEMLAHIGEVVEATPLPVNADFQAGYADQPEDLAANVKLCIGTGVAGLSIEDNTGRTDAPLYETDLAVARIRAAREAIDVSGIPLVLTGRCEAWLVGEADPFHVAIERLVAYAAAGADCLYAPGVSEPKEIAEIVRAVAPKPVNVLVSSFNRHLSMSQLSDLGVRRISVGSGLALVAWSAFIRAARSLTSGSFKAFADAARSDELNKLFSQRR
jgi:2-methylisocitrate lyase-like PEP mutase family enzyme